MFQMIRGKYEWTLLPKIDKNCNCYLLFNNSNCILYPNKINIIDLELLASPQYWCVFTVKNHMCNKPWRVLSNTLFPCPITGTYKISIITQTKCFIPRGEALCHGVLSDVQRTYQSITGTPDYTKT